MAEHYTTNMGLAYPDAGTANWNTDVEANYAQLDATPTIMALQVRQSEFPSTTRHVNIAAGTFRKSDGTSVSYAGTSGMTVAAGATTRIWLDETGTIQTSTSAFPATSIVPLALVAAGASTITGVTDRRVGLFAFGEVSGGAAVSGLAVTTSESPSTTLHVDIANGTYFDVGTSPSSIGGTGYLMLASTDNFIYWSELSGLVVNGVSFPSNQNLVRIAIVTTDSSKVTAIEDARVPYLQSGGHIVGKGATPTLAAGTSAGTSPTLSVSGSDTAGLLTVLTGTSPAASSIIATVTFGSAFHAAPRAVILTPGEVNAGGLSGTAQPWVASTGTTTWVLRVGATNLAAATTYKWYYTVIG